MSEYQYYEFLAIDRPLTSREMDDLRGITTRATITSVSLTNEYHWGDFKGNPHELMKKHFDAHVYVANWMTAYFMVKLPLKALSKKTAGAVTIPRILDFQATKSDWIITWSLDESEDYDRFGMDDGREWMAQLAPIREELLRGDLRSLYIGWLAAVTMEIVDDDETEPFSADGMGKLTAAQQVLAEFLEVDSDILMEAGAGNTDDPSLIVSPKEMEKWIDSLPKNSIRAILKKLLTGKGHEAERTLRNRFAAWQRDLTAGKNDMPLRTAGEIRENARKAKKRSKKRKK